ncbi:MAG: hypothetical protein AAF065_05525 [Verrucomicrobiota bacterium]
MQASASNLLNSRHSLLPDSNHSQLDRDNTRTTQGFNLGDASGLIGISKVIASEEDEAGEEEGEEALSEE